MSKSKRCRNVAERATMALLGSYFADTCYLSHAVAERWSAPHSLTSPFAWIRYLGKHRLLAEIYGDFLLPSDLLPPASTLKPILTF